MDPENAAPQKPEHSLGALRKSRNPATAGIAAFFDGLSVSESPPPDFRQSDKGVAIKPEVGFLSVDPYPLYPSLGEPSFDLGRSEYQAQTMASSTVSVATRSSLALAESG